MSNQECGPCGCSGEQEPQGCCGPETGNSHAGEGACCAPKKGGLVRQLLFWGILVAAVAVAVHGWLSSNEGESSPVVMEKAAPATP